MKANWVKRMTMLLAMMLIVITVLPTMVFAASDTTCVIAGADAAKVTDAFSKYLSKNDNAKGSVYCDGRALYCTDEQGNTGSSGAKIISWNDGDNKLTFYGEAFEEADRDSKSTALKKFTDAINRAKVSNTGRQNIADCFKDGSSEANNHLIGLAMNSTTADIFTALKWLAPILQFMRILIGVGAIVIVILLFASTVMDCIYIGLPMWREAQVEKGENNKPFGVSMEAISTVKEVESNIESGKYKNSYLLYFRRRALTYVVLAICLLYLIAGELGGLIQGLLDMVSGFTS